MKNLKEQFGLSFGRFDMPQPGHLQYLIKRMHEDCQRGLVLVTKQVDPHCKPDSLRQDARVKMLCCLIQKQGIIDIDVSPFDLQAVCDADGEAREGERMLQYTAEVFTTPPTHVFCGEDRNEMFGRYFPNTEKVVINRQRGLSASEMWNIIRQAYEKEWPIQQFRETFKERGFDQSFIDIYELIYRHYHDLQNVSPEDVSRVVPLTI